MMYKRVEPKQKEKNVESESYFRCGQQGACSLHIAIVALSETAATLGFRIYNILQIVKGSPQYNINYYKLTKEH